MRGPVIGPMQKEGQRLFFMGDNLVVINILAIMVGNRLGLDIRERQMAGHQIKASRGKAHGNYFRVDLEFYPPLLDHPLIVIGDVKRFARHPKLPYIVKQANDHTAFFGDSRGKSFPES